MEGQAPLQVLVPLAALDFCLARTLQILLAASSPTTATVLSLSSSLFPFPCSSPAPSCSVAGEFENSFCTFWPSDFALCVSVCVLSTSRQFFGFVSVLLPALENVALCFTLLLLLLLLLLFSCGCSYCCSCWGRVCFEKVAIVYFGNSCESRAQNFRLFIFSHSPSPAWTTVCCKSMRHS